jgi:hypothetical protein
MRTLVKLLIALSLGAALAGCVVAPAPVVVYRRW